MQVSMKSLGVVKKTGKIVAVSLIFL